MVSNRTVHAVLAALGAAERPFRRRWIPEEILADLVSNRSEFIEVIDQLKRDPEIRIRVRGFGERRQWFLEHCKPTNANEQAGQEQPWPQEIEADEADELDESDLADEDGLPSVSAIPQEARAGELALTPSTEELHRILRSYGIAVRNDCPDPLVGPTIVRHRVALGGGVTAASLRRRAEDIGRALGCEVLVSNLPGEPFIGLDLPRSDRQILPLLPAIEALPKRTAQGELWLPAGMAPDGTRVVLDLGFLPHLLAAGASGSGKTAWLLCCILALALQLSPDELELIIVDIKAVDFAIVARLPHLCGGEVVSDPERAVEALQQLTGPELQRRTTLLRENNCPNFRELRAKLPDQHLKSTVVVIDELADLMTTFSRSEREDFEKSLLRLAQRARSVGVHLLVATQRPTREFIGGAIKANLPCRIAFRLPQRIDSAVILDQNGAEMLLGAGDLLLLHNGVLQRLQAYFAPTEQQAQLVAMCRRSDTTTP
ncbi:MAG: DNA translocase FtsK [Polyangia bacterium]